MYQKNNLSDSESNDSEFSQTTIKSETEEELILSKNESDAELDDNIPSISSNKTSFMSDSWDSRMSSANLILYIYVYMCIYIYIYIYICICYSEVLNNHIETWV